MSDRHREIGPEDFTPDYSPAWFLAARHQVEPILESPDASIHEKWLAALTLRLLNDLEPYKRREQYLNLMNRYTRGWHQ